MKYYIAQSFFNEPMPVSGEDFSSKYFPMHQKHIEAGIEAGTVLFAGPRTAGGGGLFVARAESREALNAFIARDPFVVHSLARFEVTEFLMPDRSRWVEGF